MFLSVSPVLLHSLFLASILLPALYLAWCEASGRPLGTDRTPLWLGLPFALAAILLATLTYWWPARLYLQAYALLAVLPMLRFGLNLPVPAEAAKPDPDAPAVPTVPTPSPVGHGPGDACQPVLKR